MNSFNAGTNKLHIFFFEQHIIKHMKNSLIPKFMQIVFYQLMTVQMCFQTKTPVNIEHIIQFIIYFHRLIDCEFKIIIFANN